MRTGGNSPFQDWFNGLSDKRARAALLTRIARVPLGNIGDSNSVGEGVNELRVHYGPGLRLYFGRDGDTLVLLLNGGDKSTQRRDIQRAKEYWHDYQRRKNAADLEL